MLEMRANDDVILLKPLERCRLDAAAELYNCKGDIRYATGIASPVSCLELSENLDKLEASKNEFMEGIYITDPEKSSTECHLKLAGLVSGILYDKTLWIKLIAILPKFRQMGIGSRATRLLLQQCKFRYGSNEAFLSVIEENIIALHFWFEQGFSEAGRFNKALFGSKQPYKVVVMHKSL